MNKTLCHKIIQAKPSILSEQCNFIKFVQFELWIPNSPKTHTNVENNYFNNAVTLDVNNDNHGNHSSRWGTPLSDTTYWFCMVRVVRAVHNVGRYPQEWIFESETRKTEDFCVGTTKNK